MPSDTLIKQLEETRAANVTRMQEILAPAEKENRAPTKDEYESWKKLDTEVGELEGRVKEFRTAADRDRRAAESRAATADTGPADGRAAGDRARITNEPKVYDRESRNSYFLDLARAEIHGDREARERLGRHTRELDTELPKRAEARKRTAEKAYESSFASNPADRRRLDRMLATGVDPFERRFISRTDGAGGFFVPPLWLVDEYIPYLRAGRETANLFRTMPLPPGTDSINIPRIVLGTATGPQQSDGGPVPSRDIQDNFVNARVATIAGQQDAAIQILDQSPIGFDEIIFGDLNADYNMQLDGQLLLGSGYPQLSGLYPSGAGVNVASTGVTSAANGYSVQNTANAWSAAAGTANLYASVAQLVSLISRTRFMPPTHIVCNPAVWYALSSAADSQGRPLVVPSQQGNNYNQLAGDDDGPVSQGPVGHMLGIPIILDPNIPLTFGGSGSTQPNMGTISNGNVAPVQGSGGSSGNSNVYTPVIAAVFSDLFLWEGEMRSRTLSEVLSGTLQVRFQLYTYVADMVNRYQNSSNNPISYGQYNTVGTQATVLSQGTSGLLVGF